MKGITLHVGDARAVLQGMIDRGEKVDSVACDPPYHLESVVKRFGGKTAKPAKPGRDGAFARQSKGFMSKTWDGADEDGTRIAFDSEFWLLVWQVLKPGGYIVAFSASRTYHHMAAAIERAGFITHPMIGWTFASGFPKYHNAARAIDKALGAKGKTIPTGDPVRRIRPGADQNKDGTWEKLEDREYQPGLYEPGLYEPGSDEAAAWQGWHYGGQVRKPALEPIYVGQKPFSEKNGALNILKHGVGAVNIHEIIVPFADAADEAESKVKNQHGKFGSGPMSNQVYGKYSKDRDDYNPPGRWPANLITDGSDEVVALFPNGATRFFECYSYRCYECRDAGWIVEGEGLEAIQASCPSCAGSCNDPLPFDGVPIFHHAKASAKDRINTCTVCGERFIGRPTCCCTDEDGKKAKTTAHPTVKPPGLIRSLVRHVTPKGGTVLDPFAGTGTTGAAALAEGCKAILIEMEPEYAADIRTRLALEQPREDAFADLLGEAVPVNSTDSGIFEELLG